LSVTLNALSLFVQDRLEETRGAPGVFWNVLNELYPLIVEGLNEAALITGEPQVRISSSLFTVPVNTRIFSLPQGSIALLRMEGQDPIQKVMLHNLDRMLPGWEATNGPALQYWFPFGLGQFGVYPLLTAPSQVVLTTVQMPVTTSRPYTGSETVPYLAEYLEAFTQYGAHVARLKEGGRDFQDSIKEYDSFLNKMSQLSRFMDRKGVIRFSKSVGARSQITDVEVR
jgi:hypothetical protein